MELKPAVYVDDRTKVIMFESDCQWQLWEGIDMFSDGFSIKGCRALHMHVIFDENSPNAPSREWVPKTQNYNLKKLAWDFAMVLAYQYQRVVTFRLRFGSNDKKPDALEMSRYQTFQQHLAEAFGYHLHDQLEELDAPIGFCNATGNDTFIYTRLKTIRIYDNGGLDHAPSGGGGAVGHTLSKLRWPFAVTSLHMTGSSKGCGFKAEDIKDIVSFHCKLREEGGGLTEIAFHGHHEFTLRELSKNLSGGGQDALTYGLRQLTVPLPQCVSLKTRRSHQETKNIVWRRDSMLAATSIIYAEHVLCGIRSPTPGPAVTPTLQSIHFSNEGSEPTEVKIDKDEKGIVTFSVQTDELGVRPERHGPLSVGYLEWMCMDSAWPGLEDRMLDIEANVRWMHNLNEARQPTVCPQQ